MISMDELVYLKEKKFEIPDVPNYNNCLKHYQQLQLFCETCDKFICTKCLIQERDVHYDHQIHDVNDLFQKAQNELTSNASMN